MKRRTTLGAVTNAYNNRSLAGPGKSSSLRQNTQKTRFSVAGTSGASAVGVPTRRDDYSSRPSRKSSHREGGRLADPRQLGDKKTMAQSVRALVNYLTDRGYDHPISQKILARPTAKDFKDIISFLFRQFDPNWQPDPNGRFEDDVTAMLKFIRYPFAVSKMALAAVGSPHTWPTLLGCLTWMVELLNYDQVVEEARMEAGPLGFDGDPASDDRTFVDYLEKAYASFLLGDDDLYQELEQNLVSAFEKGQESVAEELAGLQAKNDGLRREIQALRHRREYLPALEEKRADLGNDRKKFCQLVDELEKHKGVVGEKCRAREAEIVERKAQLTRVREEVEELRLAVANQELSADDVKRLGQERQRLEEGMASAQAFREEQNGKLWEAELALSRRMEKLEKAVHEYTTRASKVHLLPASAKNAQGQDFGLRITKQALEPDSNLDLLYGHDKVRLALVHHIESIKKKEQKTKQELLDLLDQEQAMEDEANRLTESLTGLIQSRRRTEEALQCEKDHMDSTLQENRAEIESLEQNIAELRRQGNAELQIARNQTKQTKLVAEISSSVEAHEVKKTALHNAIYEILTLCTDNKEYLQQQLSSLKELYSEKLGNISGAEISLGKM